jgi:adenylate cyclase
MESSGIPGRVQVAPATWNAVRDEYRFEPRELDIKGLGPMTTYLLDES